MESNRVLNRALNYDHDVCSTEYLLDRLSKGYRELSLWDFASFASFKVNHNTIRSWCRLANRLKEYLPSILEPEVYPIIELGSIEYIDLIENEVNPSGNIYYCRFNEKAQYFYNLVQGICVEEPDDFTLMRKDFVYNSLCKLIYLSFEELEVVYLALTDATVPISGELAEKLNFAFPGSVKKSRLTGYFRNNLIGLFSF